MKVEVATGAAIFVIWATHKHKLRCEQRLPDGTVCQINNWADIPKDSYARIRAAIKQVLPDPSPSNPWHNQNFRFGNINSCSDCGNIFA